MMSAQAANHVAGFVSGNAAAAPSAGRDEPAPVVEQVAQWLAKGWETAAQPLTVPTLLTQANRSAGRDRVRNSAKRDNVLKKLEAPAACRECGVILENQSRRYCDAGLPTYQTEATANFSADSRSMLRELRAAGMDPSPGGTVA